MATVIGILCYISVFFFNYVELADPPGEQANPSNVIQLYNVYHYEDMRQFCYGVEPRDVGPIEWLHSGYCRMGTDASSTYIVGKLSPINNMLQPLWGPREDLIGDRRGYVKIRIDGNIANVTAPISRRNKVFRKNWNGNVVTVHVNGPEFG